MSGGKGNSRATTSSSSTTNNTTTNNVDNRVFTTDHGSVASAFDFGTDALRMGEANLVTAADFAGRGLDNALSFAGRALDHSADVSSDALARFSQFGDSALGTVGSLSQRAIDQVGNAGANVLDFAETLFANVTKSNQDLTSSNLTGLTSLAKQTSASADDRVTKVAMYAFLAIAAVFILPRIFGKGTA